MNEDQRGREESSCGDVEGIGTEDRGRNLDGCADQWGETAWKLMGHKIDVPLVGWRIGESARSDETCV